MGMRVFLQAQYGTPATMAFAKIPSPLPREVYVTYVLFPFTKLSTANYLHLL